MTIISADMDATARTMTFVAEFSASADRIWQLWADPRQLERWWGPPGYPAVISEFSFAVGGQMLYRMVGDEDGERLDGRLTFMAIEEPRTLTYEDAFIPSDDPEGGLPTNRSVVTIEAMESRARMTIVATFLTDQDYAEAVEYGALEGYEAGIGQIDDILTEKGSAS